jgi:hypothetical protein
VKGTRDLGSTQLRPIKVSKQVFEKGQNSYKIAINKKKIFLIGQASIFILKRHSHEKSENS